MTERRWTLPEPREKLTRKQFVELYMRQDGRCPECGQKLEIKGGTVVCVDEHLQPLWRGGTNELHNRELWCKPCTKPKTAKEATERAKGERVRDAYIGAKVKKRSSFLTNRNGPFRKKMDGSVERR
jgi:5-methylcytosine-specific restriction endonuclease McrA